MPTWCPTRACGVGNQSQRSHAKPCLKAALQVSAIARCTVLGAIARSTVQRAIALSTRCPTEPSPTGWVRPVVQNHRYAEVPVLRLRAIDPKKGRIKKT